MWFPSRSKRWANYISFRQACLLETNIPSRDTQNTSLWAIPMSYFSLSAKSHLKLHYTSNGRGILRRYALSRIHRTKRVNGSCTWLKTFRGGRIYIYACSRCSSSGKYWEMSVRPMWTTQRPSNAHIIPYRCYIRVVEHTYPRGLLHAKRKYMQRERRQDKGAKRL